LRAREAPVVTRAPLCVTSPRCRAPSPRLRGEGCMGRDAFRGDGSDPPNKGTPPDERGQLPCRAAPLGPAAAAPAYSLRALLLGRSVRRDGAEAASLHRTSLRSWERGARGLCSSGQRPCSAPTPQLIQTSLGRG